MARRVLLGAFPDGGYGLRVSKPGYDVMSNPPDSTQMVFDSNWGTALPIFYSTGVFALGNGGSQVFTFPSVLAYTPFHSWMMSWNGGTWYEIQGYASWGSGSGFYVLSSLVTSSNLTFLNKSGATVYLIGFVYRQAA